ncbi:pyocin knob domain-containing protein [Lentilactobacillus kefiri]|uniref:pyocin knob domain-containing protein n=1 Tax=Lentilactobacillus kefiri TaxID=33962 RepID=UPI0021C401D2|nr:pyocin knob domain-containing protein [Lentilactobacillus kefiri]MCP9369182.1 hypothetical protein [Lentilactobacillus kefiri]
MAYDLAKVTTNGNNLIAQILANKSSLSIDKIEISDTQLPSTTDISTMTSVPKVVQTVSANGFSKNSNTLIISTVVDNSSIRADYKAWVFGIWGSDSQNGQSQLIAVITSTNSPDTIPAFSGRTPVSYTYKFNIGFSNASQIKFKMINGSFATNDTVVHTTGNETINGQKKFDTDPTDGAGNAYAKTVDVNQQLDKKVNVTDMRKPASDVAGIEEVNTKQDKIGYTPADDSKVWHTTATQLNSTDMNTVLTAGFYELISGTNGMPNADAWTIYQVIPLSSLNGVQVAYETNNAILGMRSWNSGSGKIIFTSWVQFADDSKVVHNTGTEEIAGQKTFDIAPIDKTTGNPYITKDGVPSLPSDLARLSHDANFTAKLQQNGQDVALANNTISRNPDTGSVSETNTFTAAQTFSIAPVINDASTDKGDNQAATMADLKSVENSAWRSVNLSDDAKGMGFDNAFYLKNETTKQFTLIFTGTPSGVNSVFSTPKTLFTDSEISAYTNLSSLYATFGTQWSDTQESNNELDLMASISNNSIMFTTSFRGGIQDSNPSHFSDLDWVGYGKFAGTYK